MSNPGNCLFLSYLEDEDSKILRNVCNKLSVITVSLPRRPCSSTYFFVAVSMNIFLEEKIFRAQATYSELNMYFMTTVLFGLS